MQNLLGNGAPGLGLHSHILTQFKSRTSFPGMLPLWALKDLSLRRTASQLPDLLVPFQPRALYAQDRLRIATTSRDPFLCQEVQTDNLSSRLLTLSTV